MQTNQMYRILFVLVIIVEFTFLFSGITFCSWLIFITVDINSTFLYSPFYSYSHSFKITWTCWTYSLSPGNVHKHLSLHNGLFMASIHHKFWQMNIATFNSLNRCSSLTTTISHRYS